MCLCVLISALPFRTDNSLPVNVLGNDAFLRVLISALPFSH